MVLGFGAAQPLLTLGRTLIQIGALIACAGVGGMILTMHLAGPGVTPWQFIPALAVTGFGMSLVMGPFFDTVLGTVDQHETGSASGTLNAVQQLGSSLGVALLGTVFFDVLPPPSRIFEVFGGARLRRTGRVPLSFRRSR